MEFSYIAGSGVRGWAIRPDIRAEGDRQTIPSIDRDHRHRQLGELAFAEMGKRLLRLFIELNRLGTSVLIATHDHALVEQARAPELVLQNGRLTVRG